MANFQTHLIGATITGALAASAAISLQMVGQSEVIALFALGVVGGILPDIDSDDSTSLRWVFNLLGILVSLFATMWLYPLLSIVGLWVVGILVFVFIRFILVPVFAYFTVHRGSLHSLLAGVLFALITTHFMLLCGKDDIFAYCAGIFVLLGVLTHLTLDELYSVDLNNMAIKRSFGTALKPGSLDYPIVTGLQALACAAMVYLLPSPDNFLLALQQADYRFLPLEEWDSIRHVVGI